MRRTAKTNGIEGHIPGEFGTPAEALVHVFARDVRETSKTEQARVKFSVTNSSRTGNSLQQRRFLEASTSMWCRWFYRRPFGQRS